MRRSILIPLIVFCAPVATFAEPTWRLARTEHFAVYSQASGERARSILSRFEQLRAFFLEQTAFRADQVPPVVVLAFNSSKEYEPYRLGPAADAYFAAADARNYIVIGAGTPREFGIVAHEYAHLILHASGTHLPPWLGEGLAEFFSSIHISEQGTSLGGDLPARSQVLRRRTWLPVSELLTLSGNAPLRENRQFAEMFYAESWALTDMLLRSPRYARNFAELQTKIASGELSLTALAHVYGTSAEDVTRDLRAWIGHHSTAPLELAGVNLASIPAEIFEVTDIEARLRIADALFAAGELDRAETLYRTLQMDTPDSAEVSAALGTIALRRGNQAVARAEWKQAVDAGIADATLCYRYALTAEQAHTGDEEVRAALERALALQPDFDDARYHLALLQRNAGEYDKAVANLRAMKNIPPARAYAYWMALADALNELDRRDQAKAAALCAQEHATTATERAQAAQLAYIAETDLAVQFTRTADGRSELVTTRVPHLAHSNPFIESTDDLRTIQGTLREIDCTGPATRFAIESPDGLLQLSIPDPSRVEMRHAPADFVCGPQPGMSVTVEYAVSSVKGQGIIRGMEFH